MLVFYALLFLALVIFWSVQYNAQTLSKIVFYAVSVVSASSISLIFFLVTRLICIAYDDWSAKMLRDTAKLPLHSHEVSATRYISKTQ